MVWILILIYYLCERHQKFFSCLFVKFVLYTAGFLGEGTLLFFIFAENPLKMNRNSAQYEKKVVP